MWIVKNNILPPKGYLAVNIFGILFCRKELRDVDINHEMIHTAQMRELLFIPFYLLYGVEFFIRLLLAWNWRKAYRGISFEKEAYEYEADSCYLRRRRHYAWIRYIWC